jgi:DNA-binding transcriptional regulator GbsR (MarR family)
MIGFGLVKNKLTKENLEVVRKFLKTLPNDCAKKCTSAEIEEYIKMLSILQKEIKVCKESLRTLI